MNDNLNYGQKFYTVNNCPKYVVVNRVILPDPSCEILDVVSSHTELGYLYISNNQLFVKFHSLENIKKEDTLYYTSNNYGTSHIFIKKEHYKESEIIHFKLDSHVNLIPGNKYLTSLQYKHAYKSESIYEIIVVLYYKGAYYKFDSTINKWVELSFLNPSPVSPNHISQSCTSFKEIKEAYK